MFIERAKKVLAIESDAISSLIIRIDSSFVDAVEILDSCTGRVVFTGIGKSGIIGKKIASTFASIGTPAFFLHPAEGVHGDLGMLTNGDVAITLSNSAEHIFSGKPRTIEKSSLAVRSIRIMEEFSITSLVIIDDNYSPIGLIHLHDILKAGIV